MQPGIRADVGGPLGPLRERWGAALTAATGRLAEGHPGAQLFLEDRQDLTLLLDSRTGLESVATRHTGLVARGAFPQGCSLFRSDPDPADAAPLFRDACRGRPGGAKGPGRPVDPVAVDGSARLDPREPAAWLVRLEADLRRVFPAASVRLRWVGADQAVLVAQPGRPVVADRRRGARIRAEVQLHRDGRSALAVEERVLPRDRAAVSSLLAGWVDRLTRRIEWRLGAREASPVECAAVFAPSVAGVLIHELVGHALEADRALAGSWLARGRDGVASPELVVIDDPRRGRLGWRVDDEGEPARPTLLLRGGRVAGWLYDQRTAAATRHPPSGHGRRSSFREPVRPRMGCTFLAAGTLAPQEVLDGTSGVFVRRMDVARTDPATGDAVFRVTDADRIEQGRVVVALEPFLLALRGATALSAIDRVGDDLEFDACVGVCHGHAQPLAVSVGAPTIRIGLASVIR